MIEIDELIKKVDSKIDELSKELDLWEAVRDFAVDIRDNDEAKDKMALDG